MIKRVIAINSSKRKMNTYGLLEKLKIELKKQNIEVDIINLFDYEIKECLGCEQCIRGKACPIKDDINILMEKLKQYDGIVLSTPVYMGGISGKLKVFIDRTCRWFHRPELVGKPTLVVVTTAASGLKDTLKFLEDTVIHWGAFPCGSIGRTIKSLKNPVYFKEYSDFSKHLFMDKTGYSPRLNQLIFFQVQKVLAEKILDVDKNYWKKKHWDDKLFYFNCNIKGTNKIIAKRFYDMLSKKIVKVED